VQKSARKVQEKCKKSAKKCKILTPCGLYKIMSIHRSDMNIWCIKIKVQESARKSARKVQNIIIIKFI
tara:strand:- start:75 stop:278 length:204 start_codon:yes stop_codon:yes gene_type:complete